MKKHRVLIILIIAWLAAAAAYAAADIIRWSGSEAAAVYTDGCRVGSDIYLIENMKDKGVIYVADAAGKVSRVFVSTDIWDGSSFVKLETKGEEVYALVSEPDTGTSGQETGLVYRIVRLDKNTGPTAQTQAMRLPYSGRLTGFEADDTGFYLTTVINGGESAGVCFVEADQLEAMPAAPGFLSKFSSDSSQENGADDKALEIKGMETSMAAGGRAIVEADYENGAFIFHTDDGSGKEHFADSAQVREAFQNRTLTFRQWAKLRIKTLVLYLQIVAGGVIALIVLCLAMRDRTYIAYVIAVAEILLLALSAAGFWLVSSARAQAREAEGSRYAYYYLNTLAGQLGGSLQRELGSDGFYGSSEYYSFQRQISAFAGSEETAGIFMDVCLVDSESHIIMASASRSNSMQFEEVYSPSTRSLIDRLADGSRTAEATVTIDGSPRRVLGIPAGSGIQSDWVLAAVLGPSAAPDMPWKELACTAAAFILCSAVCIALLLRQNRELSRFVDAIQTVANGKTVEVREVQNGRDLRLMWNSLQEISKVVNNSNYNRYQAMKTSYRFVPKKAEEILSKDSIIDVKGGDFVRLYGTVAVISSVESEQQARKIAERMNRFVALIEKYQKENGGYFVSSQWNLEVMKLLFLEETHSATAFGISFLQELYGEEFFRPLETCMLLHYSRFIYGVAGTNTQSFSFLLSTQMRELEHYAEWFQSLGLKLVITETVKEREKTDSILRYIGYVQLKSTGEKLNMYEVLDACPYQELKAKAETNDRFQKAIQLFYQEDFYLARSEFSEVLKDNQFDHIAKWYLFTCEKYLNGEHESGDICRLAIDEGQRNY